ncbi:MAG: DUF3124 domain-containing protein [Rhodocyclaceae bacterium]|nr:DUF3124 domain-containing protein [Rhodocyclaceae bacterium]
MPIYSHIWYGDKDRKGKPAQTLLSSMVSIRNTDPGASIRVVSARYYDTQGRMIREYLPTPVMVPAFATHELFVEYQDSSGGSGANFAIAWESDGEVSPPLIEAIHARLDAGRSVVFSTSGVAIPGRKPAEMVGKTR